MENPDFVISRIQSHHLQVITPSSSSQRDNIQRIIEEELSANIIRPASKQPFLEIFRELKAQGAEGVILGCTEISLLIHQDDFHLPLFDTTSLHIIAAVEVQLGNRTLESYLPPDDI